MVDFTALGIVFGILGFLAFIAATILVIFLFIRNDRRGGLDPVLFHYTFIPYLVLNVIAILYLVLYRVLDYPPINTTLFGVGIGLAALTHILNYVIFRRASRRMTYGRDQVELHANWVFILVYMIIMAVNGLVLTFGLFNNAFGSTHESVELLVKLLSWVQFSCPIGLLIVFIQFPWGSLR